MAGIGFKLQKLLDGESYTSLFKAYSYSTIIAAGPFIIIVITLAAISKLALLRVSIEEAQLIQGLIMYIYAFSLIVAGPFLFLVARYLADKYYEKNIHAFTPTYMTVLEIVFVIQSILAITFLANKPFLLSTKWVLFALYLIITGIWIAMIFLSAAKSYMPIVWAFLIGGTVGIVATYVMGTDAGIDGFIKGFALGQMTIFLFLNLRIFLEFGYDTALDYGIFLYFKRFPYLILVGFCYYFGIWVDKFVFWNSHEQDLIGNTLNMSIMYDVPFFLAFVTIIPSMAFFLITMETSFAKKYHAYFEDIRSKKPLSVISKRLDDIMKNITLNFEKFIVFQGLISGVIIVFVFEISKAFQLSPTQMGIFRITVLGAFLQMAWIMLLNILFYFDFHRNAFAIALCFMVSNAVLTFVSLQIGLPAYGFGYTTANFITLILAVIIINSKLKHLNYWVFMKQPVIKPKFKFETEKTPHPGEPTIRTTPTILEQKK